jgi:hypothetical protein
VGLKKRAAVWVCELSKRNGLNLDEEAPAATPRRNRYRIFDIYYLRSNSMTAQEVRNLHDKFGPNFLLSAIRPDFDVDVHDVALKSGRGVFSSRRSKSEVRQNTLLTSQTIKQITTMVPSSPYPSIVVSDLS